MMPAISFSSSRVVGEVALPLSPLVVCTFTRMALDACNCGCSGFSALLESEGAFAPISICKLPAML